MSSVFERENDNIRVLSLFSGCGGMDFGITSAGG
ncbi:DNA cytosine methyltransferase, partial [Salmonella enterica subsp. enterica]|nr:DNA cytosine methyltransferase [Salmonella enterica]ECA3522846.1 DNA cytosine methyltransferase [Salmonella enterica subsp. enterica serovar Telhashomer]ECF0770532.1 DNA cytosine methyltransferase [Salmonella enterica subsp. enterica serovar Weltevreden]ECW0240593.1 DNA cytosine methyltransferase [Salmonella enterica subsp. enterica serovar Telhashomer]EDV9762874.1 DNA cytosine methyltransferase [Salmonella enterica subsp. enterica]